LLHDETVGGDGKHAPFCNVVVYAERAALTCHLAHEAEPGRPDILHLAASRHAQSARIHDWLRDATTPAATPAPRAAGAPRAVKTADAWARTQTRALVAAATAGVLRVLEEPDPRTPPEPPLVARTRVLVNNQLGDPALSVRGLAKQAGCTADYLSYLFKQASGEALAGYIVRQRMERAAHLLSGSTLAGKEVAWACGFATQSYFVRSFREHHGLTPQLWRSARGQPLV
jgi:AraC-like DNA-binding protein